MKVCPVNKTFKIGNYFQLKSRTPLALCSNVIYEFTCLCNANLTYIGMSTRHMSTRAREHLDFNSQVSSAIKNHIMSCNVYSPIKLNLNSFKILYRYELNQLQFPISNKISEFVVASLQFWLVARPPM